MQSLFNQHEQISYDKSHYPLTYSQIIANIYYIMQIHLIKNLSIGNIFIDTILQFFILSTIIYTIINLKSILVYIYKLFTFIFNKYTLKSKNIIINNKSSKLFNSVKWYLNNIFLDNINSEYYYDEKNIKIYYPYFTLEFLYDNVDLHQNSREFIHTTNSKSFKWNWEKCNEIIIHNNSDIKLLFTNIKNDIYIDNFFYNCISLYDNYIKENSINHIYKNINDYWVCDEVKENCNINSVILDDDLKYEIISNIKNFIKSEIKYDSFNILFKKTYLFYGPSGTGKSLFIKAIANHLNYKIYYLNLDNNISEYNIIRLLNNIHDEKSILVIENINLENNNTLDSLISSCTKNIKSNEVFNILNIVYNHKIASKLVILTTNLNNNNNYDNLQFIDVKYKFNNCSSQQFKTFYNKFYNNLISKSILNKINTSLFTPLQLIKIYLNNINNEKRFLLEISNKHDINIDDDIHYYFNNGFGLINNNKIILSAIVLSHFCYLFKTHDNIKKYKLNQDDNLLNKQNNEIFLD